MSKPKTSKRVRQWTLLIISNRGKSITIKWFKTLAITAAFLFVIAITASLWFGFLYKSSIESNKNMRFNLKNLQRKIISLEHEKDILMARLILTESRVEESMAKTDENSKHFLLRKKRNQRSYLIKIKPRLFHLPKKRNPKLHLPREKNLSLLP